MSLSHNAASLLRWGCFLLLLEILQLPSQLRSWFQGTVCAVPPHLECLLMMWCMSEQRIKRTLSRSDWNWNHFIMRHYGKCRASEGAINIVKPEPNAVSIQRLHVLVLGMGFIVDLFLFAVLFKCLLLQIYDRPATLWFDGFLFSTLDAIPNEVQKCHKRSIGKHN